VLALLGSPLSFTTDNDAPYYASYFMFEQVERIFSNVNDWLNFAEAKNGALIAFNSAVAFGLIRLTSDPNWEVPGLLIALRISILVLLSGLLLSLVSFLPRRSEPRRSRLDVSDEEFNPLFFKHIAAKTHQEYNETLHEIVEIEDDSQSSLVRHYGAQIVNNARIAEIKYRLFTWALILTLVSITLLIGSLLYKLVCS